MYIMAELILFLLNLAVKLSTCSKIYGIFFCTYTPALFYLTIFWCSELICFIPHVYHKGRTHSFSFEFGSETEYMLKNLWYVFLYIYPCAILLNKMKEYCYCG